MIIDFFSSFVVSIELRRVRRACSSVIVKVGLVVCGD